jgi:hypothetical protein
MSLLVLDDFLEFPTIIREWAINQEYYTAKEFTEMYGQHTDWPGRRTKHVVDLDKTYADKILTRVASIASSYFGLKNISIRSYFQLNTKADGDSWVHQDNNVKLAAILYLNPTPLVNTGTTLYHCKDVNLWESYMSTGEGYNTLKTINRVENTQLYQDLFEPKDVIGNVFNRLVLYPGTEYHKSNNYFGNTPKDGRLTQIFFINEDND